MHRRPWWRGMVARCAYVVIGAGVGLGVSLLSSHIGTDKWLIWACLAIGLTAASGAVFGYGLARWPEIAAVGPIRASRVAGYVALLAIAGVTMLAVSSVLSGMSAPAGAPAAPRGYIGLILVTVAGVAAVPVVAGLAAIRDQARAVDANADDGRRVEALLAMRRLLAGFLTALGAEVSLATLALGASPADGGRAVAGGVVVFGAAESVFMALAYAPAAGAVRSAARDLCHTVVPLSGAAPTDLPARVAQRRELEQALGVDRGLLADLQSGVIVIAPLLASAAAVFLPG